MARTAAGPLASAKPHDKTPTAGSPVKESGRSSPHKLLGAPLCPPMPIASTAPVLAELNIDICSDDDYLMSLMNELDDAGDQFSEDDDADDDNLEQAAPPVDNHYTTDLTR
jgi:hypothetical protein